MLKPTTLDDASRDQRGRAALTLLAIAFLLAKPYTGIRHDSTLYLGQALIQQVAPQLRQDLFFFAGSQAQYTVFPWLIGRVLEFIPASTLFLVATLIGRLLFLTASWVLVRRLLPLKLAWMAMFGLLLMPTSYGRNGVLAYGELFFTGRTLAEPLVLLAMAAMIEQRWVAMVCSWSLAALIHPLQAFPALLVIGLWLTASDRRWLIAPITAVPAGLLFPPIRALFSQYDTLWWDTVIQSNPMVLLMEWSADDLFRVSTDLFFVCLVGRHGKDALKKLATVLLVGATLSFFATFLLGDLLRMVWPTGMQFWRIEWLLHWFAMASLPWLLHCHYDRKEWPRFWLLVLVALLTVPVLNMPAGLYGVTLALIGLYVAWPQLTLRLGNSARRLLIGTAILMSAVLYGAFAEQMHRLRCPAVNLCLAPEDVALWHPLPIAVLTCIGVLAWGRSIPAARYGLLLVLLLASGLAAATWDARSERSKAIENAQPRDAASTSPFGIELEPHAQVLWPDELLATWLVLQRPAFLTDQQLSGLLFNRGTSDKVNARKELLRVTDPRGRSCSLVYLRGQEGGRQCQFDQHAVESVCAAAKGTLDYVVLPQKLSTPAIGSWELPSGLTTGSSGTSYSLYRCSDFTAPEPGAAAPRVQG